MPDLSTNLRALGSDIKPGERVTDALTAQRMNAVFGLLRALANGDNVINGLGILKRQVSGGVMISSNARGGGGGGGAPAVSYPFDVTVDGTDATVRLGTINGVLPTNYDDVFTITNPGVFFLVLSATASDGEIASATLSMPTSPPAGIPTLQGQPPTAFDYLIGVVIDGIWYRTVTRGGLNFAATEMFRISKTSPSPGTLPYDIYWSWVISRAVPNSVWMAQAETLRLLIAALPMGSTNAEVQLAIARYLKGTYGIEPVGTPL